MWNCVSHLPSRISNYTPERRVSFLCTRMRGFARARREENSIKFKCVSGLKTRYFSSLWAILLCVVLVFLLCLLFVLVVSVIKLRKRYVKQKHKKVHSEGAPVATPVHSDDDHNPDIIPQIEGTVCSRRKVFLPCAPSSSRVFYGSLFADTYVNCSRRQSATSHSMVPPQQYTTEFSMYNIYPEATSQVLNYSNVPMVCKWVNPILLKLPLRYPERLKVAKYVRVSGVEANCGNFMEGLY